MQFRFVGQRTLVVNQLEHARSNRHRRADNDTLANPSDPVLLAVEGRLIEVVGGALKRGQQKDGFLHFHQSVTRNAKYLASTKKMSYCELDQGL